MQGGKVDVFFYLNRTPLFVVIYSNVQVKLQKFAYLGIFFRFLRSMALSGCFVIELKAVPSKGLSGVR